AAWICEWIANAALLTGQVPSTTSPSSSTSSRSRTRICLKFIPKGFTQNRFGCSGSRTVMWPATPSSKRKRPKTRNAAARRCLRWRRSSATSSNVGNRWGVRSGTTAPNLDLRHLQGGERLPQLRLADLPGWRVRQLLEHHPLLRDLVRGEVVPRE